MTTDSLKADDEIELMDLFFVLWRRKWIVFGIVCFSVLIAVLFISTQQKKMIKTELGVALAFDGIDKGLYPDGAPFNSTDIVSFQALGSLGLDRDLSDYLFVEKVIPDNVKKKIAKNPSFIYFPDKFNVVLLESGEILFDSDKQRTDALIATAELFKKLFKKRYIEEPLISLSFPEKFIKHAEYDDVINILQNNMKTLTAFLMQKIENAKLFQSDNSGDSFSKILNELSLIKETDFKRVVFKVNNSCFARDRQNFVKKIKNEIKNVEFELMKNKEMAEMSFELLKFVKFQHSIMKNVGTNSNNQFVLDSSVLKKNDYIFDLIKLNINSKTKAIENRVQLARFKDRIEVSKAAEKDSNIADNEITEDFISIQNKIMGIVQKTNNLNFEYFKLRSDNVIKISGSTIRSIKYKYKTKLILLSVFIGALFFSVFISFLVDYIIRYRKVN